MLFSIVNWPVLNNNLPPNFCSDWLHMTSFTVFWKYFFQPWMIYSIYLWLNAVNFFFRKAVYFWYLLACKQCRVVYSEKWCELIPKHITGLFIPKHITGLLSSRYCIKQEINRCILMCVYHIRPLALNSEVMVSVKVHEIHSMWGEGANVGVCVCLHAFVWVCFIFTIFMNECCHRLII